MEWNYDDDFGENTLLNRVTIDGQSIYNKYLALNGLTDELKWDCAAFNLNEKTNFDKLSNDLQTLSKISLISSFPKRGNYYHLHKNQIKSQYQLTQKKNCIYHSYNKINVKKSVENYSLIDYKIAQIIARHILDWTSIETIKDTYFNKIDINSLPNVLVSFKGLLSPKSQEILYDLVLLSRDSNEISIASSNAATILARINYPFVNKDLSRIKIPNANLSGSLFIRANLDNSDLSSTNLSQSHFYFTNFRNCKMKNSKFGQLPAYSPKETCKTWNFQACFSPCGKFLAISTSKNLIIRDIEICKNIKKLAHEGSAKIFWSPCGNFICLISENTVKMIDIKKNYLIVKHKVDINPESFSFSKNWRYWGSCKQTFGIQCFTVNPWKKVYGEKNNKMFFKYYYGGKFLFSNCENYMIIGRPSVIYVFKISNWRLIKEIICNNWFGNFSLSATLYSKFILLSFLNCIQLVNIKTSESIEIAKVASFIGISQYEKCPLIYEPDAYAIKTIDLENQKISKIFFGNFTDCITSIACSPCGQYVATVTSLQNIKTYECTDICPNIELNGHLGIIKSIEISESGNYMITSSTDLSILWEIQNKFQIKQLLCVNHYGNHHRSALSRTDSYFVVFNQNQIFIGNIVERKVVKKVFFDENFLYASFSKWNSSISVNKIDKFVTIYSNAYRSLQLLDIENQTKTRASSLINSKSDPLGFSPCGTFFFSKYLSNSKSWRITIWNMKIMKKLEPFDTNMKSITGFAASYPALQFIFALVEDKRIAKIFNIGNYASSEKPSMKCNYWKEIQSDEDICQVAFSYCQMYLIACLEDKLIKIWNLDTEKVVLIINSLHKSTLTMKFAVTSWVDYIVVTENNFFWILNMKEAMNVFEENKKADINWDTYKTCLVWHSMNGNLALFSCNFNNSNLSQNNDRLLSNVNCYI